MAFDAFVKINGIEGESTDMQYPGWIEAFRFGTGLRQSISTTASSAGGTGAERADFEDFIIRKLLDKASPKLAVACADGTHIDEIVIKLCRGGTEKVNFMTYILKNCFISRIENTNGSDVGYKIPAETVRFRFGRIEWCYMKQNRQGGGVTGHFVSGWDLQKNRKI